MQIGYLSRLESDMRRWVEAGTVSQDDADAMLADARSRKGGYSFSSVIVFLGVISLLLGALTFVAANWQGMPRLAKVALLIAAVWVILGGSTAARGSGHRILADALVMLSAGIFGAAIMLVGQIYHLQGKASDAVLLWAAGAGVAGMVLQSRGALWLTAALITIWLVMTTMPDFGGRPEINLLYPLVWLATAALAWWLHSRLAAHLLALGAVAWIAITVAVLTDRHEDLTLAVAAHGAFFLTIGLALLVGRHGGRVGDVAALALNYAVLSIIALTGIWIAARAFGEMDAADERMIDAINIPALGIVLAAAVGLAVFAWARARDSLYDLVFCVLWIAVVMLAVSETGRQIPFLGEGFALALSIWFIRMGGRQDAAGVTRLGYLAFALVMGLLYFRTAGTLLGTSGFYLGAGLILVLGAVFVPRLLRGRQAQSEGLR